MLFVPIFMAFGLTCPRQASGPSRGREAVAFLLGGLLPAVLFAVNAYVRFGSPLDNGYPNMRYTNPVYEGVFGLMLSPGKGLLWYAPVCIVSLFALRRSYLANRRYALLVASVMFAHLAIYSRFETWSGENAFGPRYLVPILPLLVALIAPVIDSGREWSRGVKVAALVGFVVPGLLGASMYFNGVYWDNLQAVTRSMDSESLTARQSHIAWNFQPRSSPLMQHLRSIPDLVSNTSDRLGGLEGGITPIPVPYEERIHWYARAIELDVWWAWWPTKNLSALAYLFLLVPVVSIALSARLSGPLRRPTLTRAAETTRS